MLKAQLAEVTEQLHRANEHIKLLSDLANKRIQSNAVHKVQRVEHSEPEDFRASSNNVNAVVSDTEQKGKPNSHDG